MSNHLDKKLKRSVTKKWGHDSDFLGVWYSKLGRARRLYLLKLWEKDCKCVYCKNETLKPGTSTGRNSATYEHMTPISRGGTESRSNAVLSCSSCNNIKGNMTHEEFVNYFTNVYPSLKKLAEDKVLKKLQNAEEKKEKSAVRVAAHQFCLALLMFNPSIKALVEELP